MRAGQALVVVLMMVGVALTVGLSIVSRSITEVNVSTVEDESADALSAAEAGIERALGGVIPTPAGSGTVVSQQAIGSGNYNVTISNQSAGTDIVGDEKLVAGEIASIKMAAGTGSSMRVCWGDVGQHPAIEVIGYSTTGVFRMAFDPQARSNGFTNGPFINSPTTDCPQTSQKQNFEHSVQVDDLYSSGTPIWLRLRMLYNGSVPQPVAVRALGVAPVWNFPVQGMTVTSVGQVGSATQKIVVDRPSPDWAPMFDDAVFSGGDLSQ